MARTGRDLTGQKFGKLTVLGFGVWRCGIVIVTAEVTVRWKDICWSADGEKAAAVSGGQQIRWRESALENWWF